MIKELKSKIRKQKASFLKYKLVGILDIIKDYILFCNMGNILIINKLKS